MSSGLSLADIRIKYSIPANVTDSEVMQFANDSNITINFSATQNAKQGANPFNYNGVGNSIYTSEAQATSTGSNAGTSGSTAMSADGSIFGNGYANASVDLESPIEGFAIQRTTTPAPAQQVDTTTFAQWQQSQQVKKEEQVEEEKPQQSPFETRVDSLLEGILGESKSSIVSREEVDGKCVVTLSNGQVVEFGKHKGEDGYDSSKTRSDISYKIYNDGKVVTVYENGERREDLAVSGEIGYVKDGESFSERLARFNFGGSKKEPEKLARSIARFESLSLEEKQNCARRYVADYLAGKSDAMQIADFKKLLRNTPPDSEMGRALVSYAGELNDSVIDDAIEEIYGTRQTDDDVAVVTDEVTSNGFISKVKDTEAQAQVIALASNHVITEDNARNYSDMTTRVNPENQTFAVEAGYENIRDEKLREIHHSIVSSNIHVYDKKNTLDIANIVIANDDEEHTGAQNMAEHAHETDVDVQKELAELLLDLQVDSVSGKIASHAYEYDITNRDDIIQMVKDHGTEGAKQILEEVQRQYEEQAAIAREQAEAQRAEAERIAEENARRQEQNANNDNNNVNRNNQQQEVATQQNTKQTKASIQASNTVAVNASSSLSSVKAMMRTSSAMMVINSAEFKSLSAKDTVEVIKEMNATERKAAIKNIVENSEANQLQGYMFSEMKKPIIAYLVSQPTPDNASKLQFLQRYLDGDDKRFIEQLREERNRGVQQVDQNRKANPFGA